MDEKVIKDLQYRKGLSIAYFNSLNSAISLVTTDPVSRSGGQKAILETIAFYQEHFLKNYNTYYSTVISNVGVNYDKKKSLEKLSKVVSKEGLKKVWIMLSEDERRDPDILKVARELKEKYEKTQHRTTDRGVASPKKG